MLRRVVRNLTLALPAARELQKERDLLISDVSQAREEIAELQKTGSFELEATGLRSQIDDLRGINQQLQDQLKKLTPYANSLKNDYGYLSPLEGTNYSRYLVPIEYLPSRDFQPRWGYSRPRIESIDQWFRTYAADFKTLFDEMREYAKSLWDIPVEFYEANLPEPAWVGVPYCAFDSLVLYTIVRKIKPRRYVEIGSGITTCFTKKAIIDEKLLTKVTSIDPEPRATIDAICDEVLRVGLETCDPTIFESLEAGDILFFDGSHRSFMNSDVTVFFIDVLPRVKPGVIIHIHDIALPWDYDAGLKNWYWNEAYMLAVYLMGNKNRIKLIAPTSFMCRDGEFETKFAKPMIELGVHNDGWRGGGAMWFTHTSVA